ncbi:cell wall metabolism sensor histidine kinase WalK [bacterium]|nr:cell wall metabolism sensor histidine kinase WalK [bacterium]
MQFRWQSLRVRYAIFASFFIAIILIVNAVLLLWMKYSEFKKDIDERAFAFSNLAAKPVTDGYENYYFSGYFKFRELMHNLMEYEPDLIRIFLINVDGKILFDSDNLSKSHFIPGKNLEFPQVTDSFYLDAIRKIKMIDRHIKGPHNDKVLEIISPNIDEWGRHKYSVVMWFSYQGVWAQIESRIYQIAALTIFSMLITSLIVWWIAGRITRPVVELTERARGMASASSGDIQLEESDNEIKVLTNTFNSMTARIHENIRLLEMNNVKLGSLNEELKELDRMKSDLLANVSHELRTPLTSIKGYAEYILEGKLGPVTGKQEKALGVVQRNLERLSKLINALLDYSFMDAQQMVLHIKPFDLKNLTKQIIATLASELEKRAINFNVEIPDDLPSVMGDKDKLYLVLENLTINAIKFTETNGSITISAHSYEHCGKPMVELRVIDTGVGIPKSELDRIFDRFYQVDATSKRKYGGMGLGLAIARSIVEAHKGMITAESEVGKGTTFTISLPAIHEHFPEVDQPHQTRMHL